MDDIMIASKDVDEHFQILKDLFLRLAKNKFELRMDKCEFQQIIIKYLGFIINGDGIKADDIGIEAIKNFPIPDKTQHVQSFLGLCSYQTKIPLNEVKSSGECALNKNF